MRLELLAGDRLDRDSPRSASNVANVRSYTATVVGQQIGLGQEQRIDSPSDIACRTLGPGSRTTSLTAHPL